jgi:hypothetical protein
MTRPGRLLLVGVAAFILALPLYLPAAFVFALIAHRIPPGLNWREVSGTLLEPSLHAVSINLPYGSTFIIDEVTLDPGLWSLFAGRVAAGFEVRIGNDRIIGTGSLGPGGWQIETIDGKLQVQTLNSRIPGAELAISSGQVELSGKQWTGAYNAIPDRGMLKIRLMNLQSDLAGPDPLGDYSLEVTTDEQGLKGDVTTTAVNAALNVNATVSVNLPSRMISIDGAAEAKPGAAESVRGLLPLFGAVENNRAQIRFSTAY